MVSRLFRISLPAMVLLLLAGCATQLVTQKRSTATMPRNPRIALLPFENLSGKEKAGQKITEYFQALMAGQKKFECVEYGETFDAIRRFRIRSASQMTDAQVDSLAAGLHADFILTGSVLEYDEYDNTYLGKVPQISFNTRLIDCATKKTVWVGVSNGSGDRSEVVFGIGAVRSADQLAHGMVSKSISKLASLFPG